MFKFSSLCFFDSSTLLHSFWVLVPYNLFFFLWHFGSAISGVFSVFIFVSGLQFESKPSFNFFDFLFLGFPFLCCSCFLLRRPFLFVGLAQYVADVFLTALSSEGLIPSRPIKVNKRINCFRHSKNIFNFVWSVGTHPVSKLVPNSHLMFWSPLLVPWYDSFCSHVIRSGLS